MTQDEKLSSFFPSYYYCFYHYYHHQNRYFSVIYLLIRFFTLEIPVIRSAKYQLPIISEICICMFSLYIKMKFWCQDSSKVRFLRIDPMVSGSSPTSAELSLSEESRQLSTIPDVGITRCGHIERKDLDTAQ